MPKQQTIKASPIAATPIAFARSMALGARRLGHEPTAALLTARITEQQLVEPNGRITANQMEQLSDQLMRELDDEALGWFSRRLPWGSYGMLARASITSPTLQVALQRWCRHHALLTDDIRVQVHLGQSSTASISLQALNPGAWLEGELLEFCHVSMLRNLLGLASWLVDSKLTLTAAEFAFDAPPHAQAYGVLFPTQCTFGQDQTRIHFSASYLSLPVRRDEAALRQMLQRALPLTVHTYRKDRLLIEQVRQAFKAAPACMRNADVLANALHLSTRTLHRQLKDQGTSLQALKNSVRVELATELLQRTQLPINKIALAVGLDNDKGFIRAYRHLTGLNPGAYRKTGAEAD